jgi:mono/diheme cytochrome c family protein
MNSVVACGNCHTPRGPVVAPPRTQRAKCGAYLAGPAGHCLECHTPFGKTGIDMSRAGAGGTPFEGPWGVSVSRNLTPHETGLKGWSDAEIATAIRTGVRRTGERLKPPMAFDFYRNVDDADMAAIVAYLRTLKPVPLATAK